MAERYSMSLIWRFSFRTNRYPAVYCLFVVCVWSISIVGITLLLSTSKTKHQEVHIDGPKQSIAFMANVGDRPTVSTMMVEGRSFDLERKRDDHLEEHLANYYDGSLSPISSSVPPGGAWAVNTHHPLLCPCGLWWPGAKGYIRRHRSAWTWELWGWGANIQGQYKKIVRRFLLRWGIVRWFGIR